MGKTGLPGVLRIGMTDWRALGAARQCGRGARLEARMRFLNAFHAQDGL
jgi:hypothetical protein